MNQKTVEAIIRWLHAKRRFDKWAHDYVVDNHWKADVLATWWDVIFPKGEYKTIAKILLDDVVNDGGIARRGNLIDVPNVAVMYLAEAAKAAPQMYGVGIPDPDVISYNYETECFVSRDKKNGKRLYLCERCLFWHYDVRSCSDGIYRCEDCTDNWSVCDSCGARIVLDDCYSARDEYGDTLIYCRDCADGYTEYCEECDRRVTTSNWDEDREMCLDCAERQEYRAPDVVVRSKAGYTPLDTWRETHSADIIGAEIEVYSFASAPDKATAQRKVLREYKREAISQAYDGSLSSWGCEFRICPAPPDFWETEGTKYIKPFFDILRYHGAKKDSRAGMHLHIDEGAFQTRLALYNFCRFFHDQEKFTLAFSGREDFEGVWRWAPTWRHWDRNPQRWERVLRDWEEMERYCAVNLEKRHGTIEVRIFGTTTSPDEFIGRINAIWSLVELANMASRPMTISPVNLSCYMQKHMRFGWGMVDQAILAAEQIDDTVL